MRPTVPLVIACITLTGCIGGEVRNTDLNQKGDHGSSSGLDNQQKPQSTDTQENSQNIAGLSSYESDSISVENIEAREMAAQLSLAQVNALISSDSKSPNLGVTSPGVIIPSYIPEGYLIDSVSVSSQQDGTFTFYNIKYRHQINDSCFGINHYAYDEPNMGDAPNEVDYIEQIEVPGLGITVDVGYIEFSQMSDSSIVTFHLVGNEGDGPYFYHFYSPEDCASPIDLTEVRQVVGSFQFLTPEPTIPLQDVESFIFSVSKGEPPYIQALMMSDY